MPAPEQLSATQGTKPGNEGVTALPLRKDWIFSGTMTKKVISATGIKWQPRFSVLTADYLAFTRPFDRSHNFLPDLTLTSDVLRKTFEDFDVDKNGKDFPGTTLPANSSQATLFLALLRQHCILL